MLILVAFMMEAILGIIGSQSVLHLGELSVEGWGGGGGGELMAIFSNGKFTKNGGDIRQKCSLIAIDLLMANNGDGEFTKTKVKFAKNRH